MKIFFIIISIIVLSSCKRDDQTNVEAIIVFALAPQMLNGPGSICIVDTRESPALEKRLKTNTNLRTGFAQYHETSVLTDVAVGLPYLEVTITLNDGKNVVVSSDKLIDPQKVRNSKHKESLKLLTYLNDLGISDAIIIKAFALATKSEMNDEPLLK